MALMSRRVAVAPGRVPGHNLFTWGRVLAAVIGLFAATALVGPAAANINAQSQPTAGTPHAGSSCTHVERLRALAVEQRRVLSLVGDFRVLNDQADLDRLAVPNPDTGTSFSFYSHMFVSMRGAGFTVVNLGPGAPGKPSFLMYRPSRGASDVLDPFGPDFPYRLVGWGYISPYVPGEPPAWPNDPGLRCIVENDWFVHERSVHPLDTWQNIAVPPVEQFHGQVAGDVPPTAQECDCVVGIPHGRFWDLHLWPGAAGFPTVSMFNPGKPIPGFDPLPGIGFFRPETEHVCRTGHADSAGVRP